VIAGKFRLTRQLGQGGMGSVWAAVHATLGREVAVKFLQPQRGHNPSLTDRFVTEAHIVASIKHRFVVDVFDYGVTEDGIYYMVLELLHGCSLADRMDNGPAMGVRQGVQLMADCLRGLHVVHEAGIIHRDLKPDNIFVVDDADGMFPKLIDFGISRRTQPANLQLDAPGTAGARKSRLTQPGTVLGTPYYMSPEQLRGRNNVDRRSDVYAVGVILFELLAGRLPFDQDNVGDLMVAITVHGPPSLSTFRPELGEGLAAVIKRALAALPDERYATALELREALLKLLPKLPSGALCAVQSPTADLKGLEQHTALQLQAVPTIRPASIPAPPVLVPAPQPIPLHPSPLPAAVPPSPQPQRRAHPGLWLTLGATIAIGVWLWAPGDIMREPVSVPLHVQREALPVLPSGASAQPTEGAPAVRPTEAALSLEPLSGHGTRGAPAAAEDVTQPPTAAEPARSQPMAAPRNGASRNAHPPRLRRANRERQPVVEQTQKLYRKLDF
jgi:serine/threonine-protein kinase